MNVTGGVFTIALAFVCFVAPYAACAQQAGKTARVGWVFWAAGVGAPPDSMPLESFRARLRELGWVEGQNLVIEARAGDRDQARDFAAQMVRLKVDVIVTMAAMTAVVKGEAGSIPIVFAMNGDPVEAKWVASYSRPGGNVTGITALADELAGKRLDLLNEVLPHITRVAILANATHPGMQRELRSAQATAKEFRLTLQLVPVHSVDDFDAAFEAIASDGAEAIVAFPDTLIARQAKAIAEFAARRGIPAVSGWPEFAQVGNLMGYGADRREFYRHLAVYVDKILKGAKPADLPVEQPTKYELTINLKTAKALGLTIPPSILVRAKEIIN